MTWSSSDFQSPGWLRFSIENLCNGILGASGHGTRVKFYGEADLTERVVLSRLSTSKTKLSVVRQPRLFKQDEERLEILQWKGLTEYNNTLEQLTRILKDVPHLTLKFLARKTFFDRASH